MGNYLSRTGSASILFIYATAARLFGLPFGRAAEHSGVIDRQFLLAGEQHVDRIARILCLHQRFAPAVVDATLEAQDPLLVEDEDVRREWPSAHKPPTRPGSRHHGGREN